MDGRTGGMIREMTFLQAAGLYCPLEIAMLPSQGCHRTQHDTVLQAQSTELPCRKRQ